MGRSFRLTAVAGLALALSAGAVSAGIPDPALSTIPNVVASPGGTSAYQVSIQGAGGPVVGATVRVHFSGEAQGVICWCGGIPLDHVDAVTDASGVATFHIAAGGCLDPAHFVDPPATVYADGVFMAEVGMVSPDDVDPAGLYTWEGWDPGTSCAIGVSDAVNHTTPIKTGAYSYCTDLNSDGAVGILDAVIVTAPIKTGAFCNN